MNYNDIDWNKLDANLLTSTAYGDVGPIDEYGNVRITSWIITTIIIILVESVVLLNKKLNKSKKIAVFGIITAILVVINTFYI